MKRTFQLIVAAWILCVASASAAQPTHAPLKFGVTVKDKNFYLLSLIEHTPKVRAAVQADAVLSEIATARNAAVAKSTEMCNLDVDCYANAFVWTDADVERAGKALAALYRTPAVRDWTEQTLRASGAYVRHDALPGDALLERAWADCARGMNHIIDVYGLGKAPRYPAIDSITYEANSAIYRRLVQNLTAFMVEDRTSAPLFYSSTLRFALELMEFNHRDEAARYEPMETGENAGAIAAIRKTDWSRFAFTAIVVPGAGNDRPGVRLSAAGKLRDEIAAARYHAGKAPLILVSGGFVHPKQTEYCEAIEMKRDLMTRLNVPESAIVIDPHARHTTTNLRNAARLLYRYGVPFDKPLLVTTDTSQSAMIEAPAFAARCANELGYQPFRLVRRINVFDLEVLPLIESLHIDSQDPLDP